MTVIPFPSGPFVTNAYIVACPVTNQAAIIDPAPECQSAINAFISKNHLNPIAILLTHTHWDHIADVFPLKEQYKCPVYVHELDANNLIKPGADQLPCWIDIKGVQPDHFLEEGSILNIGELEWIVIHTPGHSPGSICFYCPKKSILISGDTLFQGTIGNLSFPTSKPKLMWGSLKKLSQLPKDTIVYPGHGPSTTIGDEPWLANAEHYFGGN